MCEFVVKQIFNSEYDYQAFGEDLNTGVRLLQKKIKAMTGESANGFINYIRLEEAAK